jgi:hypothetical protein
MGPREGMLNARPVFLASIRSFFHQPTGWLQRDEETAHFLFELGYGGRERRISSRKPRGGGEANEVRVNGWVEVIANTNKGKAAGFLDKRSSVANTNQSTK